MVHCTYVRPALESLKSGNGPFQLPSVIQAEEQQKRLAEGIPWPELLVLNTDISLEGWVKKDRSLDVSSSRRLGPQKKGVAAYTPQNHSLLRNSRYLRGTQNPRFWSSLRMNFVGRRFLRIITISVGERPAA
jgi:hypothetical protein